MRSSNRDTNRTVPHLNWIDETEFPGSPKMHGLGKDNLKRGGVVSFNESKTGLWLIIEANDDFTTLVLHFTLRLHSILYKHNCA